ncbi:helix-turn-helix transcriptional regulator [Amaricoccus tamworthensis]|uniref:helix-turn-helix transcriptional regulator n=1 Tax=Amaricoccus tamworthensis TaxID=57002 RepID=UPI003C7D0506
MSLNMLIDAMDTSKNCRTAEEKWAGYTGTFFKLGSPFVTIGEADIKTGEVLGLQSTNPPSWFARFFDQNYKTICPHVPPVGVPAQNLTRSKWLLSQNRYLPDDSAPIVRDYYDDIAQFGYSAAVGIPCGVPGAPGVVRVLLCGAGKGDEAFVDSDTFRFLTLLAPVAAIEAMPLRGDHPDIVYEGGQRLSPREKDVLCLLANGYMNARIAEKLQISEVTVRMHMTSARKKLKCATRDQAMALALVRGLIQI